jgi:hypothetical protein
MVRDGKSEASDWIALVLLGVFGAWLASSTAPQAPPEIAANEAAAISTLRTIADAQARVKADVTIDTNDDGVGEYGYLAELAGTIPKRVSNGGVPAAGNPATDRIRPPLLRPAFGEIAYSSAVLAGYRFQMWLSGPTYGDQVWGVLEDFAGGKEAAPFPDPRNGAGLWCCYAWPVRAGATGKRAFFINQEGELLECANDGPRPFSGTHSTPKFGEAFERARDMSSGLRVGPPAGGSNDTIWTRVW